MESRATTIISRLVGGHMFAYPIALAWTLGAVPLAIAWSEKELLAIDDEQTAVRLVLRRLVGPAVVAFVAGHIPSIPWAFGASAEDPRPRRIFWRGSIGLLATGALFTAAEWAWFLWKTG